LLNRILTLISIASLLLIAGCAEENPNLVNPTSLNKTIRFRLFNFAADKNPRQLSLSGERTSSTGYKELSGSYIPPATDSLLIELIYNNQVEYTLPYKFKMIRDQRYLAFSVPKPFLSNPADSLLIVGSSFVKLNDTNKCFIQMLNINNTPDISFSMVLGCQNGMPVFSGLAYLGLSNSEEFHSGNIAVSLLRNDANGKTTLGLFDLNLRKGGDYLILVVGDMPSDVYLIDKMDTTSNAIRQLNQISTSSSQVRTVNLSESDISAKSGINDNFLGSLNARAISDYKSVMACTSNNLDSIAISVGTNFTCSLLASLVVNDRYTLIVSDSAGNRAAKAKIIPNLKNISYYNKSAVVRVLNLSEKNPAITLSLGARSDASAATGYRSGEALATNLSYEKLSHTVSVLEGRAPLTLFTASSPDRLLYTGISYFEQGKSYLIIITNDATGKIKLNVINEEQVNSAADDTEEGAFAQIANITPGLDFASLSIDNVMNGIKLYNSISFATVLPFGDNRISAQGQELSFRSKKDNRDLLVLAGTKSQPDIIHIQNIKMAYNSTGFNRRFLNAAADAPMVTIYDQDKSKDTNLRPIVTDLNYKSVSEAFYMELERKYSYFFYLQPGNKFIKQINDISMTFGKNYTVIFGGDSTVISTKPVDYKYSIILLQEY
jgi:hypothetical protein